MRTLDLKLVRDLRRLWAQTLAIALVMASGVATLILASGAYRSLEESRIAYYERNGFGDVFANATRVPNALEERISAIPGVRTVETRISKFALLDIIGMAEPASGLVLSIPDGREPRLNRLHLREGRLPEAGRVDEVTVNEQFARVHGFVLGSTIKANLNGRQRTLTIVGVALSPEFIYAIGPGDLMPDDRRFAILWMSHKALATVFDLNGAFNSVSLTLSRTAVEADVIGRIDDLLGPFGGAGAYGRKDQVSNAFIEAELKQLASLARVMPPIFLAVAAFLINITLSRMIALEREQIGLLKAIGYSRGDVAVHYVKLVLLMAAAGIAIGFIVGAELGIGLTRLYAQFFHFPVLVFSNDADVYAIAAGVSCLSAVAGALQSVRQVLALTPAVAMQPPAPARYRHGLLGRLKLAGRMSPINVMAVRHMVHSPVRAGMTWLGLSLAVALLVTALMSFDSIDRMIDIAFNHTDRQQATLSFTDQRPARVVEAVAHLPGVLRVEPMRAVAVRIRNGARARKLSIIGKPRGMDLSRVVDLELKPIALPPAGLALSSRVADILAVRRGDVVDVEMLEGKRRIVRVAVTDIIESYFGLAVYMDLSALDALTGDGPRVTSTHISFDEAATTELFAAIKKSPMIASIGLQRVALAKFKETLAQNITYMVTVYVTLAVIIAFGIVYNSARIQLSERARELASLRVLGFTRAEASRVLLTELAILTAACLPLGWVIGYGFSWILIQSFTSDLYRAPFIVSPSTFAIAGLVVLAASAASALIVRRRIDRLDLVAVLKTRE